MAKQIVDVMVEGGKATAAPPLGPALGPTGVNIGQVVAEINKKTADMKGMQVPVKVTIDPSNKSFEISIGTPPAAALIKKEAGVEKGASNPLKERVADLKMEQIIKIAKMKESVLLGKDVKARCREIVGTCQSMGMMVEGMSAQDALKAIAAGQFDEKIKSGKTELTEEEKKQLLAEKKKLQEDIEKKRSLYEARAKDILKQFEKDPKKAKKAMMEAEIPMQIINELVPEEEKKKK
ncbi:50S ribosomal protein L11 [Candidatus Woesearchaeota archaeon CG_4_10_14_0_2_um_filter_33_13]|nr:MAG: 50S ribosomal protein L11 [Candidatus Woesearchaeota archaeon CG_4_10_14_0_2_um_filter_33_13]